VPVNLNTWTAESYLSVPGSPNGVWNVSPGGNSVTQAQNGQSTFFYSDFNALNTEVSGKVRANGSGDDDFIGFALGFQPGDSTNNTADYLLVDWKRGTQDFNFGGNSTPGSTAFAGLAVSLVTGIPTADEFWGHVDFPQNPNGGLTQLARGTTLGSTGWGIGQEYEFDFVFTPTNLQVFVDGNLELNINGTFNNGRLAFYNFSEANVTYSAFEVKDIPPEPPTSTPEPSTILGLGVLGFGAFCQRKLSQGKKSKQDN
jgi:hypothetical protein